MLYLMNFINSYTQTQVLETGLEMMLKAFQMLRLTVYAKAKTMLLWVCTYVSVHT